MMQNSRNSLSALSALFTSEASIASNIDSRRFKIIGNHGGRENWKRERWLCACRKEVLRSYQKIGKYHRKKEGRE